MKAGSTFWGGGRTVPLSGGVPTVAKEVSPKGDLNTSEEFTADYQ
jgi:hypothetical protein